MATQKLLICRESFVASYDGEGRDMFVGRKGITLIDADSREAKLWAKFFEPAKPSQRPMVEQATAAPGELRGA